MAKNQTTTMTSEAPRGTNGADTAVASRPVVAATAISSGPGPVVATATAVAPPRKDVVGGEIRSVIVELPLKPRDGKQVRRSLSFASNAVNAAALERHARGLAALDGAAIAESVIEDADANKSGKIEMVMIELPTKPTDGYAQRSVHVDLTMKQSQTLKQITEALEAQHAELEGGRRVRNASMTIEWILEQIGRQ